MEITKDKFVGITYTLTVDGKVEDQATAERPLEFIFGVGMLLQKFEENLLGKTEGDTFAFTLSPEEGYGVRNEGNVVDLPKSVFMVDGEIVKEALTVGNILPMSDTTGHQLMGKVVEVKDDAIRLDFNHPMAGKTLDFTGSIVTVREATTEDKNRFFGGSSCGCHCGGNCGDGCDCGEGCNCDGGCQ